MSEWSPAQYERFSHERRLPFEDLLALVEPRANLRVVDLGCGTGTLTRRLHDHVRAARTIGVDSSATMLAKSDVHADERLRFVLGDLASFDGEQFDLVFSNAALHWVPDHPSLLRRLVSQLAPGGQLAVHVPFNHEQPSHIAARRVAGTSPFREALEGHVTPVHVLAPERYATLLHQLGFVRQHVRLQVYTHVLRTRDDIVEWVRGTTLTDYERRLSPELFASFIDEYRVCLRELVPDDSPYCFTFNRILMWGSLEEA